MALLGTLLLAGALGPAQARALPGPSQFVRGFVDDPLFERSAPGVRSFWLNRARSIGSSFVRIEVFWDSIAPVARPSHWNPSNPADRHYDWSTLDGYVRALTGRQENVLLVVRSAPGWATAPNPPSGLVEFPGTFFPSARALGQFAHALALRYSGHFHGLPRVRYLQAWNEPNLPRYLVPQWQLVNGRWVAVSPRIYRGMLNAFYAGAKSAVRSDVVLAAGTAPYGDNPGTGQGRMRPVTFYQQLFCLTPSLRPFKCGSPPHLDALDHHPYAANPLSSAYNPLDVSVPDLGRITRVLSAAERYRHVTPLGPKQLWVTELDWATIPPVTGQVQAKYLALAFYKLWSQGVSRVFWFLLQDYLPQPNSFRFGGIYNADGSAKPAVAAYRFPFVALRAPHHRSAVWGVAPRSGTVTIQKLTRGRWRTLTRLRTAGGNVFYGTVRLSGHVPLRAVVRGAASPAWTT